MDFVRRRLSQGGSSDDENKTLSLSLTEGTSRFFTSMVAKKNGLINNLSSRLENVMKTSSSTEDSSSGPDSPVENHSYGSGNHSYRADNIPYPYKSKKKTERIGIPRRHSSSGYSDSSGNDEVVSSQPGISFDEPLYSPTSKDEFFQDRVHNRVSYSAVEEKSKFVGLKKVNNVDQAKAQPSQHVNSESKSNVQPLVVENTEFNSKLEQSVNNDIKNKSSTSSDEDKNNVENVNEHKRPPKLTMTKRRSSTVDEMLFDDYVPPQEEEQVDDEIKDKCDTEKDDYGDRKKTLIPMGDLISFDDDPDEPEITNRKKLEISRDKLSSFTSISSIESSEYWRYNQASVDSTSESEFGGVPLQRTFSIGSENSWSSSFSIDSQPDEITLECMEFMKHYVDKIFDPSNEITQTEKAKFGKLCQEVSGRQWFARYVNGQRVNNKCVSEQIFFRLVQYFAVVLFECNFADDFSPAKSLMTMCFTFYYEGCHGKNFLYSYLREQDIWHTLRFWNAAFFDALQYERSKRPVCTSDDGDDTQRDDRQFQENITFGQLGTFTCNMRAFGLSKELCLEFLRKQSTIANLKKEQVQMLKDNVDKWKDP